MLNFLNNTFGEIMHLQLTCSALLCLMTLCCWADNRTALKTSITLSPHLTELVYSAGGGEALLGVSAYSNYPPEVETKQIIGDAFHLNLEVIKALNPDVIFYWHHGTPVQTVEQLKQLELNLVSIEINQLDDIPAAINTIATHLNSTPAADPNAFNQRIQALSEQPHKSMGALIQISNQPIYTVNGHHWMSEAIGVCGLRNVFAELPKLSSAVTLEAAVLSNPDVIVSIAADQGSNPLLAWQQIPAIKNQQIISLEADHFTRPTLRTLLAIESLCKKLSP